MKLVQKDGVYKVICLQFVDASRIMLYDVEEYACGYGFFYIRHTDGKTESFPRNALVTVERRVRDGSFRPIHLKKPHLEKGYDVANGDSAAL